MMTIHYLCSVKTTNVLLLITIIILLLLSGTASGAVTNDCTVFSAAETKTPVTEKKKTASFNQSVSKERYSIETFIQPSVTARIGKRNPFNGLFLSFFLSIV
jgi:hypothetical protein